MVKNDALRDDYEDEPTKIDGTKIHNNFEEMEKKKKIQDKDYE
jgi:hypothetical protein|tara:strand:+ start:764 stop:892 length:129 start_codon:yes stop_codon:yes gene_type:complete